MQNNPAQSLKAKTIRNSRRVHKALLWIALAALLAFVLSALCHPIMAWTGPQTAKFFPPSTTIQNESVEHLINFVRKTLINNQQEQTIRIGKVVPTEQGPLLQITHNPSAPRDYYTLETTPQKLEDFDQQQAIWLARYYSDSKAPIQSIEFINTFSNEYPWVNRLLPVYKIVLDTDDQLTLFIHTETNALASINNNWKKTLQTIFQWFHTWSWLDDLPVLRVLLAAILLIVLITATLTGGAMLFLLKNNSKRRGAKYFHRKLAWIALLPFLGLLISGLYHLLQSEYGELPSGMRLNDGFANQSQPLQQPANIDELQNTAINSLSLIPHRQQLLLRASVAVNQDNAPHKGMEQRKMRFKGQASESRSLLFSLTSQNQPIDSDKMLITEKAMDYLQLSDAAELTLTMATHFGPDYDFRNKRLPVWLVKSAQEDVLAIDPQTGIIVEHTKPTQKLERLSFSLLHKWNMLTPLLGREGRDVLVVIFLLMLLGLGYLGTNLRKR